jgi:hypothetical protein
VVKCCPNAAHLAAATGAAAAAMTVARPAEHQTDTRLVKLHQSVVLECMSAGVDRLSVVVGAHNSAPC